MSFVKKSTFAANPHTTRGESTKIDATKSGKIVYANGKTVIIRDLKDPSLSATYSGHVHKVSAARISPTGYYCASADVAGNVRVWDTSFLSIGTFPPTSSEPPITKSEIKPFAGRITDIAWDGESKRLIAVGEGRERFGHAFMFDSGSSAGEIGGHNKVINSVSIRHQRPFKAVTGSDDGTIGLYSGVPFKFEKTIKTHTRFVQDVKYSPSGDLFASVGADYKAFLYDGKTAETIGEFENAHTGSIMAASWSSDNKSLVTSSADRTVKLWDVETRKSTVTWTIGSAIQDQQVGNAWAPGLDDGIVSLSVGGDLNVFDKRVGDKPSKILYGPTRAVSALSITKDDTLFAGDYSGRVTVFSSSGDAQPPKDSTKQHTAQIVGLSLSEDGSKVASVGFDDKVKEVDVSSKDFTSSEVSLTSQAKGIASLPSSVVATISANGVTAVKGNQEIFNLPVNYGPSSIASSPADGLVAVGGEDNKIYIYTWKGDSLDTKGKLEGNRAAVTALAFSPDGTSLVAGDSAGKIVLYDVAKSEAVNSRWTNHSGRINSLAWTSDAKHIASGSLDNHIFVWTPARPIKNIPIRNAIPGGVNAVKWLSDDKTLVAGGADGCVRSWTVTFHA